MQENPIRIMIQFFFIFLFIPCVYTIGRDNKSLSKNVTSTLDRLLASNRYDKRIRPNLGGPPVNVSVNFLIKSMGPVSDDEQSFGLDCYFRQHWYDMRLRFDKLPDLDEFTLSWLFHDKVWKPDTYFVNGKKTHLHRITSPNKFLRLRYDGFITYSMRLTIKASCPMYLRKFPLDAQRCPLILGSYGYSNKDIVYEWNTPKPVSIEKGLEIAQFDLVNVTADLEMGHVRGGVTYSTLQTTFLLKRQNGYFMLQVYVPCGLIVLCSWISFWIDPDAVPARVTLGLYLFSCGACVFQVYIPCGLIVLCSWVSFWIDPDDVTARVALSVTTVLSLTTMGFGGRAQLPKVSYWTALDWFVIICYTSVFSVMIEYACVNFVDKVTKDLTKMIQDRQKELKEKKIEVQKNEKNLLQDTEPRQRSSSWSVASPVVEQAFRRTSVNGSPFDKTPFKSDVQTQEVAGRTSSFQLLQRKLSTTIRSWIDVPKLQDKLARSMQNLSKLERGFRDADMNIPRVIVTDEEDTEDITVDMIQNDEEDWADEEIEQPKPASPSPFACFKAVHAKWVQWKFLPQEVDVAALIASEEPPPKFSTIDIESRKKFPLAFFISLSVYLVAYAYYLTDEFPERDSDVSLYRN